MSPIVSFATSYATSTDSYALLVRPFTDVVLTAVVDEDEQKIQSSADRKQLDEIYTRVYRTLKNGITVGGRHFEFLAFGNSQLRDHGCYMFNSDEHISADMIREWMGVFDGIKTVAKYAGLTQLLPNLIVIARLGQCFSTTRAVVDVDVAEIPDIEYNGYCFSDGVNSYLGM
jgi:RNA-dependent RNA polymerase